MKRFLIQGLLALACLSFCAGAEAVTVVNDFATLRDAVKNPDSLDIQLGGDITITAAIPVSLDAKIDGAGKKLIAGGAFRHFNVESTTGSGPTFMGVTFEGGANGGGISVASGGKATFEGGAFENNRSAAAGGAVSVASGGEVTFDGTAFKGNQTTSNGGAVSLQTTGKAAFKNDVLFSGNRATGSAGALYAGKGEDVTLSPGTLFRDNSSGTDGGAIYVDTGVLTLPDGVRLTTNDAKGNGGAVSLGGAATAKFGNNPVTHNHAKNGGAVYCPAGSKLEFTQDIAFSMNSADEGGGAVYSDTLALDPEAHRLTFNDNHAKTKGGAVYVTSSVTVNGNVTFSDNISDGTGGAVHSDGNVTVQGGTFRKNEAKTDGGAIYAEKDISVKPAEGAKVTLEDHTAGQSGGALCARGRIEAENTEFKKNKATADRGGATKSEGETMLTNCVLEGNSSGKHGGASIAGSIKARRTTFSDNTSTAAGGAVYLTGDGTSSFANCVFSKNQANANGGALFLTGNTHTLSIEVCTFDGNYAAGGQGGALDLAGSDLTLSRCFFTDNKTASGPNTQGGAARIETTSFGIANCTFYKNEAGQGGAVHISSSGGSGTAKKSALLYCTFARNVAGGGQGGGLWTACPELYMMGVLSVGNTASFGADIFSGGGKIKSQSYNILSGYGEQGSSGPADKVDWKAASFVDLDGDGRNDSQAPSNTFDLFFGSNVPASNSPPSPPMTGSTLGTQPQKPLLTLALRPTTSSSPNPALDAIPKDRARNRFKTYFNVLDHTDERGVDREAAAVGACDIGAYESGTGIVPPDPGEEGALAYVKMSGIPNTHIAVGQTTSLVAIAYDQHGTPIQNAKVEWKSSNPSVARIDAFGNLYARSVGKTIISVTTVHQAVDGKPAMDSADLTVREEMSYTNVHPEIWKMLGEFNDLLGAQGVGLTIADSDPKKVRASAFQKAFRDAWGTSAAQVTELKSGAPIRFERGKLPSAQGWSAPKPAIDVSLGKRGKGDLLPLKYRWSLSWDELSTLMGRKVTKAEGQELFDVLKLAFVSAGGGAYTVVGTDGVTASQAISSGALEVTKGNNGVTLELTAFVADAIGPAASSAKAGPRIVEGLLVVPDGIADGTISGAMGLLQRAKSGGGSKGEGGGGGCNAGVSGLALIFAAVLLRRKRV